jgi:hypothetical protein
MSAVRPTDWHDYPLEDFGWVLRCGYTWEAEDGDEPTVTVHEIELVTRREVPMALNDLPGVDLLRIEEAICEKLLERLAREAEDLHELRRVSREEYEYNRRMDA